MPDLPSDKGQLNITGVQKTVIEEFKKLCDEEGRKQARMFEFIFKEWKALRLLHGLTETELHPTAPNVHGMIFEAGDKTHRIDQDLDEPKHKRDRKHGG